LKGKISWEKAVARVNELPKDRHQYFCQSSVPKALTLFDEGLRNEVQRELDCDRDLRTRIALLGEIRESGLLYVSDRYKYNLYQIKRSVLEGKMADIACPLTMARTGRFDKWKYPQGVIAACDIVRRTVDFTLVLVGSTADDDPEAAAVLESVKGLASDRTLILSVTDALLVNALQRHAAVILQKSIREGFGLTVAEAMWKGTPVIGGNVGGIRHQIINSRNGFLVNTVQEAAMRILELLQDPQQRERMGANGRELVRQQFLLSRLAEDWLDLIASFGATTDD
jgi:glycosyltransferase involved in cell wall biosynthesis